MPPSTTPVIKSAARSPGSPAPPRWTSTAVGALASLAMAAAVLRFSYLGRKPFWFDECFSVEVARLSWQNLLHLLWRREANMSLYYLLLRGWLHFGSSPFFVRSLSVIVSLATLPAIFWLARKLFDARVALIAVALISFNAYHIRYAQEARSYSLFVLLATLANGFFVAAFREPSSRNRRTYMLASVLAAYAHLYAWLMLAAHWLSLRGPCAKRMGIHGLRRAWIGIGLASLPLVIFAAKTGAGPIRWIQRPSFRDLLEFAEHISGNAGLPLLLLYAAACLIAIIPPQKQKMMKIFRTEPDRAETDWDLWRLRFLLVWLFFPVTLTLLLSLARPLFLGRYFIFCLPALVILAAAGLARLRQPWLIGMTLAAMLLLSLQGAFSYYNHDFDLARDGSEAAANYVLDHAQPGDVILFHIAETRVPYEFFKSLRAGRSSRDIPAGPEIIYPRHGDQLDYRDFTGKPTSEFVRSLASHQSRMWLVLMSNASLGRPDATTLMLDQILGESFPRVDRVQFPQVEVRVFSKP
jgi:mannosyltransferase